MTHSAARIRLRETKGHVMKFRRIRNICGLSAALWLAVATATSGASNTALGWEPNVFADQGTLQLMTVGSQQREHWSKLWLVVIERQLYVRLGNRAFARVQENASRPYVKVKIAGREFDRVRIEAAPEMTERVAAAMA